MVTLLQRVSKASVAVEGEEIGAVGPGLLVFLGVEKGDTEAQATWLAQKCCNLRIFADEDGDMNLSLNDVEGEALIVPQFTLCADTSSGNRPSFTDAAPPDRARALFHSFVDEFNVFSRQRVEKGRFGAMMDVQLTNDGPVTFWLEREPQGEDTET